MAQDKIWIIQKCINESENEYQDWPGYCETPMTGKKLAFALKECEEKWSEYKFRGCIVAQPVKKP